MEPNQDMPGVADDAATVAPMGDAEMAVAPEAAEEAAPMADEAAPEAEAEVA